MNGWYAILAFIIAWAIAQLTKVLLGLFKRKTDYKDMSLGEIIGYVTRSGGMPSGHSASTIALTTYIGCWQGFDSAIFALAAAFVAIVLYDATHVRYVVGLQGVALNRILKEKGEKTLPLAMGHTILQVLVGSMIGILVGLCWYFITKG